MKTLILTMLCLLCSTAHAQLAGMGTTVGTQPITPEEALPARVESEDMKEWTILELKEKIAQLTLEVTQCQQAQLITRDNAMRLKLREKYKITDADKVGDDGAIKRPPPLPVRKPAPVKKKSK